MATLLHAVWNALPLPLRCRSKIPTWLIDLHSNDPAVREGATAKGHLVIVSTNDAGCRSPA
jgi:hypothetical protein